MFKRLCIIFILVQVYPDISHGQEWKNDLSLFFKDEEQIIVEGVEEMLEKLKKKQEIYKNEEYFLKYLFHKVHQKYLKNYSEYSTMEQTLDTQVYDCVTGVALYAIFLKELGYSIEIHETIYHVYLMVKVSDDKKILFEATDAMYGFIKNPQKICDKQATYLQYDEELATSLDSTYFEDKIISIEKLAGIQFYNQALIHYKNDKYDKAYHLADWAMKLYPNERIKSIKTMSDYYTLEFKSKKF